MHIKGGDIVTKLGLQSVYFLVLPLNPLRVFSAEMKGEKRQSFPKRGQVKIRILKLLSRSLIGLCSAGGRR